MTVSFYLSLIFLFFSVLLLGSGYHAVDLSYNVLRISYFEHTDYYTSYGDLTLGNKFYSMQEVYRMGWIYIFIGFYLMFMAYYLGLGAFKNENK